ncbi:MAG: hypothetical protein FWD00_04770, partial [Clostridiales bacterium]|nr:hypothetical protein [Clostridiales bacterium]
MRKNLFKQNMKRALGLLLAVVMVLGLLPMAVLAAPGYDEPVTVSTPHATVGNDWDALQAALSTAQDGDIINLTAAIVVPVGQDWTLGFMGGNVTLQVTGNFRHFLVDGTLTLNDGVTLQGRRPSSFTEDG